MTPLTQTNTAQPLSIGQIVKDLLSPAEHFARMMDNASSMEASAWQEISHWHEPTPVEFGCGFIDSAETRRMVGEICQVYAAEPVTEPLLAYLYLKHRQLLLTHPSDFYYYDGRCHIIPPWDDTSYEMITAHGYSGCFGRDGDIVDFHGLDQSRIPFGMSFPAEAFWQQLGLDYELPMGLISYDSALEPIEGVLHAALLERTGRISYLAVLDDLARRSEQIEREPLCRSPYIALVVHARLLQGLQKK